PSTRPPRVEGRRCLPAKSLSMCSEDAGLTGATSPPMDLTTIYAPIQDELSRLHRLLEQELAADDPFVSELVRHVLSTQGKLIRPALVCLSAQAGGGAGEARLWLAEAVELIHIASLIHDDIIDESEVRRGMATVNVQWGNQIAVLLGDYLFAKAFDLLSRIRHPEVAPTLAVATVKMSQAESCRSSTGRSRTTTKTFTSRSLPARLPTCSPPRAGPGPWWRATPPPPSASGLSACSGAWRFRSPTTPWI